MKLSDRLQLIADEINIGETMADIGTDHGFLPLYLLDSGKCPHVIMADISPGSLKKAEENCQLYDKTREYDLRLGNGIDVLADGEVDVVAIAGMGGLLICDILGWNLKKQIHQKIYSSAEKRSRQTQKLACRKRLCHCKREPGARRKIPLRNSYRGERHQSLRQGTCIFCCGRLSGNTD